jgi:glycosyltransferase involved in cell wall biosynthesis
MNKLYTYGCSFTQGMWEFDSTEEGEVEYRGIGCSKVVQYNSKDNWGRKLSKELNLEYVNNTEVDQLISSCDAMINIAKLESFSNNFVEAWQMKKLLLVTDADWSRDSCGNAAFYLDVENLEILSNQLIGIITNNSLRNEIILNGENHIQSYPSPIEKMTLFVDIINKYTKD